MRTRPAIFKWRQTESGLILCAVRWYLRYSLSLRDVEEMLEERSLPCRSHYGLALGAVLWPGVGAATATASQADQQVLASGRNLRSREGAVVLLVSGHRFQGSHHRFPAVSVS